MYSTILPMSSINLRLDISPAYATKDRERSEQSSLIHPTPGLNGPIYFSPWMLPWLLELNASGIIVFKIR